MTSLTRDARQFVVSAPSLALVEAKNDNVRNGLGQCIAEMVARAVVNERAQRRARPRGRHHGTAWQFLRLDGDAVTLDTQEYHVEQVARILAILRAIVDGLTASARRPAAAGGVERGAGRWYRASVRSMFNALTGFRAARQRLTGMAELTDDVVDQALRDVRVSLLEADVELGVVKR